MAEKFKVELVTPKGVVFNKEVEEVIAPGIMGEFGVLIGHTPLLTFIKPGVLSYLENNTFHKFVVGPGFCEVLKDSMTILVEEAYGAQEIDPAEAAAEVSSLEKEIAQIDAAADPEKHKRYMDKLAVAKTKAALGGKS
jgi:F-type H+-transporting ATPase subunit epsilon|uniref:ATP synthase epsilon chain n=1 Tax=Desulfomonile tiedjei TaxID=2358 RepID=A0A7C4EYA6_9BACT